MGRGWMKARGPLDENDRRRLVLQLVTRLRCVECGKPYNPHDFALVDRREDVWVLGIQCRHCGSSGHIVVLMRLDTELDPVVDLTSEELEGADQWLPITADDVLDVHTFLQEFNGDFEVLFAP